VTRVSLAALATLALLGAAACQDAITSPQGSIDSSLRLRVSNPPPPPADTGASGSFIGTTLRAEPSGKLLQPRFSIQQGFGPMSSPSRPGFLVNHAPASGPASSFQSSTNFHIPITYFFSPADANGYIHFSSDQDNGVNSSSNGMLKVRDGVISGKGMLTIETYDGVVVIDLSSVQQPPSFIGCGAPEIGDAPTSPGGVCFELFFTEATFTPTGGEPIEGSVQMEPGCPPDNEACFID